MVQKQEENCISTTIFHPIWEKNLKLISLPASRLKYIHQIQRQKSNYEFWHFVATQNSYFHFLSHWMGYDRGDSFPFDSEPNLFPFGSKSKGKLSPWSYPIQFERKWKYSFLSSSTKRPRMWFVPLSTDRLLANTLFTAMISRWSFSAY